MTGPKATKPATSIVAERLAMFMGRTISIRVTWSEAADIVGELVATYPLGRDYFIELHIGGRPRVIATSAILEITEPRS